MNEEYVATLIDGRKVKFSAGSWPEAMKLANRDGLRDIIKDWECPDGIKFETHYKHL